MKYKITLCGRTYEVEVNNGQATLVDEYEAVAAAPAAAVPATPVATAPAAPAAVIGAGEVIRSPMPGTILKVNVNAGQAVKEGDVLVVLEAMKMENEIMAPKSGTVTQIIVAKGANVDTDAPLVVIG